jgi:hypothetical protein
MGAVSQVSRAGGQQAVNEREELVAFEGHLPGRHERTVNCSSPPDVMANRAFLVNRMACRKFQ